MAEVGQAHDDHECRVRQDGPRVGGPRREVAAQRAGRPQHRHHRGQQQQERRDEVPVGDDQRLLGYQVRVADVPHGHHLQRQGADTVGARARRQYPVRVGHPAGGQQYRTQHDGPRGEDQERVLGGVVHARHRPVPVLVVDLRFHPVLPEHRVGQPPDGVLRERPERVRVRMRDPGPGRRPEHEPAELHQEPGHQAAHQRARVAVAAQCPPQHGEGQERDDQDRAQPDQHEHDGPQDPPGSGGRHPQQDPERHVHLLALPVLVVRGAEEDPDAEVDVDEVGRDEYQHDTIGVFEGESLGVQVMLDAFRGLGAAGVVC